MRFPIRGLAAVALMIAADETPAGATTPEPPPDISLWQKAANLGAGFGYKDNVGLSSSNVKGSPLEQTSLDLLIFRLPWNNWQLNLFGTANDTRYFDDAVEVDTEQFAALTGQLTWFLPKNWKSLTTVQYTYMNQVLDVSATQQIPFRQQVLGHVLGLRQGWRKDFAPYWTEANFGLSRSYFKLPLDDYWQGGPQFILGRSYGKGSELSLSYQAQRAVFDTREQTQPDGSFIPGAPLEFTIHNIEAHWQHYWDDQRRWRTTTRFYSELNQDNGPGFYDYRLFRLGEQARYRASDWEISAQVSVGQYDFAHRRVSPASKDTARRTSFLLNVRGEKALSKRWKAYATFDREQSFSNVPVEQYAVNIVLAGVQLTF